MWSNSRAGQYTVLAMNCGAPNWFILLISLCASMRLKEVLWQRSYLFKIRKIVAAFIKFGANLTKMAAISFSFHILHNQNTEI